MLGRKVEIHGRGFYPSAPLTAVGTAISSAPVRGLPGGHVFAVIAIVLVACGGAPAASPSPASGGPTVTSSDGNAVLTIPDGALPAGISVNDLAIETLESEILAAYEFEPSGTAFDPPLSAAITLPLEENGPIGPQPPALANVPMLVLTDDASLEVPNEQSIAIDQELNQIVLTAPVAHFSEAYVNFSPMFVGLGDPSDQVVGQPFTAGAGIHAFGHLRWQLSDSELIPEYIYGTGTNFDKITWTAGPYLSPDSASAPASTKTVNYLEQQFTCTTLGTTWLSLSVQGRWSGQLREYKKSHADYGSTTPWYDRKPADRTVNIENAAFNVTVTSAPFKCTAQLATVTPSPRPTPTPSAVEVVTTLPEGHISGMRFVYNSDPIGLAFSLYWYGFDISGITLTLEGADGDHITDLAFNPAGPGFDNILLQLGQSGPVRVKQVIVTKPDGTQVDITKPFVDFLGTDTMDVKEGGESCWGSLC
jgi:hypothetical protein